MLQPPPLGSHDLGWLLAHCPPTKEVCKYLDIDATTLNRWRNGANVPRSALIALYWFSDYGQAHLKATIHNLKFVVLPALGHKKSPYTGASAWRNG